MDPTHIAEFKNTLRGTLLESGDAEYEAARLVWNGMINRRPRFIVQCCGVADVIAAVRFAHAQSCLSRSAAAATT
jgi:hypothetical protein